MALCVSGTKATGATHSLGARASRTCRPSTVSIAPSTSTDAAPSITKPMATGTGVSLVISATERGDATRTGRTERVVHDVAADDPDAGLHDRRVADEGLAYGGLDGRHVPAVLGTDPPAQGPVGPRRGQAPTGVDRAEAPDAEDPEIGHLSPFRRRPSA